ncbi:MAG TPA: energy coupling factor transporter S component ThiW [Bacillus sp. (in: firmicutes)]|uniref:energy coupling factor transporter S component ThiW n=1 Tax=Bacillus litorisediminis TaxID=2922713 RepID=UPI001FAF3349|nr:energy coupling factor transporter S component ThiW [Bacillus litorisediminis]HWO75483.1 energy coupling factor transporter S component ThiW [Bacillus sp. (in: firmicutes)]
MNRTRLLALMALFVAIGTLGSHLLWFPAGAAKAYPVQHAVNVLAAVILGPLPATAVAFMIGLLRNLLGFGTILAFPGGMIGAFLAGVLYLKFGKKIWAAAGEVVGTGIIGALIAVPIAKILMGTVAGVFFFIPPFLISSLTGAVIASLILAKVKQSNVMQNSGFFKREL